MYKISVYAHIDDVHCMVAQHSRVGSPPASVEITLHEVKNAKKRLKSTLTISISSSLATSSFTSHFVEEPRRDLAGDAGSVFTLP